MFYIYIDNISLKLELRVLLSTGKFKGSLFDSCKLTFSFLHLELFITCHVSLVTHCTFMWKFAFAS